MPVSPNSHLVWLAKTFTLFILIIVPTLGFGASSDTLIWVGESRGVLRVTTDELKADLETELQNPVKAIAVDGQRNTVWALSQQELISFDHDGARLTETKIKGPLGEPNKLVADSGTGTVWAAIQKRIHAFDATGQLLYTINSPLPISAWVLDNSRSRLWYATDDGTLIAINSAGEKEKTIRVTNAKKINSLAYDAQVDKVWVVTDQELLTINSDGIQTKITGDKTLYKGIIDSVITEDGSIWLIDKTHLLLVGDSGQVLKRITPFENSSPSNLVDLALEADGTILVATQNELARLSESGETLIVSDLDYGDKHKRLISGIGIKDAGISIKIDSPEDGSILNLNNPEFIVSYSGVDIIPQSIQFQIDGVNVDSNCSSEPNSSNCMLDTALLDGVHRISVTIENADGAQSPQDEIEVTIDTIAPVIVSTNPENGTLTNNPTQTIIGTVSEQANVTVYNQSVALDENLQFSSSPVNLQEGINQILIQATDAAINTSSLTLIIHLDTVAPTPPIQERIEATIQSDGVATVTGNPGSVEGNSIVTVTNVRTSESVTIQANADGSFTIEINAQDGDELSITAKDTAGNVSDFTSVIVETEPGQEPLSLSIVSPNNNSFVTGNFALVQLLLQGPSNTGLVVNNIPAHQLDSSSPQTYYAVVPVNSNAFTIEAIATTIDGRTETRSIVVNRSQEPVFSVSASPESLLNGDIVKFQVQDIHDRGIERVVIDADGDGVFDIDTTTPDTNMTLQINHPPGINNVQVLVVDSSGQTYQEIIPLLIIDPQVIDTTIRVLWSQFIDALSAGDIENALTTMSFDSHGTYGPLLESLSPHIDEILPTFSNIEDMSIDANIGSYTVLTLFNGEARAFIVTVIRESDGTWKITSM